jgi:flagellar M-ring protein FliF
MERLNLLAQQLKGFFLSLPPARRWTFVALTVGVLLGTIALAVWIERPQYRVLFANLDGTDAAAAIEYLKGEKIPYRVSDDKGAIEVPAERVYETRMALAGRGIPQGGGVGFEIFDKQTIGMTDFVQRLDYQRALQGELARTIGELAAVESARVHLALPERSLFVTEDRRPSASVVVRLRAGRSLQSDQVNGIVHLVASSVEGLRPGDVTVVDINGQVLSRDTAADGERAPAQGLRAFQKEIEQGYAERIESMLERVLGPGHAVARVTVALDLSQEERTEESYDPDKTAVRSEKRSTESNVSGSASGVPGVAAVLTNDTQQKTTTPEEGPRSERQDSLLSYEVTKVTSRRVESGGGIRRVSVAVLIDGIQQGDGAQKTFAPRPQEELDRYRELIKRSVGFNDERGDQIELVSAPFQSNMAEPPAPPSLLERLAGWQEALWRAGGLAVILLVGLMVVRPFLMAMVSRVPLPVPELETTATVEEKEDYVINQPVMENQALTLIARNHPEQTAMVIKHWVAEVD